MPITGRTVDNVRPFVRNALDRAEVDKTTPVLVFEFVVPPEQEEYAATSKFGVSSDLADFLLSEELSQLKTVAYVPQTVQGHAVLAVLACGEIAMHPEAELGPAGLHEPAITPRIHRAYEEIANRRKKVPPAVALGLVDPAKCVYVVETEFGRDCVAQEDLEELRNRRTVQENPTVLFEAGQPGRLSGKEARDLDIVSFLATSRQDIARIVKLPPEALQEDPSLTGDWRAVRVDLRGPITAEIINRAQRMIEDAVRQRDVNFVCLWIDSPGGSLAESLQLANFLAFDLDPGEVRTVAYVPNEALSDASLIAMACDHVVMHQKAILGGEGDYIYSEEEVRSAVKTIREGIARQKSRSWSLLAAMVDPNLEVFRYTRLGDIQYTEFFCEEEWSEQFQPDAWEQGKAVTTPERPFWVTGQRGLDYRVANEVVGDFAGFKAHYGLENDPALLEPGWADFLVQALANPLLAGTLLLIGFYALYIELHMPGMGIGGFVAAVCFLLYFWSGFLGGTAGWLEVTLFLAGFCFLAIEIFVLPGFGIFGLGGGLLILASLVLASQTFVFPQNQYQVAEFRRSITTIAAALMGLVVMAMLINRWLPHMPVLGGMILHPVSPEEAEQLQERSAMVHFENLVGTSGRTTTQLTPGGKAQFGDDLINVMADSEVIPAGTEVVVVEVHGNRVLVRAVEETV